MRFVQDNAVRLGPRIVCLVAGLGILYGLFRPEAPRPAATQSPTQGHLVIAVAESHAPLCEREARLFESLYPNASIEVRATSTCEAYAALGTDGTRLAITDRPPSADERHALAGRRLELAEVQVGTDALVLLVPISNRITSLTFEQVTAMLEGRVMSWNALPDVELVGPIHLVMPERNSGGSDLIASFFPLLPATARHVATQREVMADAAADPFALGVVSAATWKASGMSGVRALAVAPPDPRPGVEPRAPFAGYIQNGEYPLCYPIYVVFDTQAQLAAGFSAFVSSAPGQNLLLHAGLAPKTMPVRVVQFD